MPPGSRGAVRLPSVAYDTPPGTADNLMTADDKDMFTAAGPLRLPGSLLGKRRLKAPAPTAPPALQS